MYCSREVLLSRERVSYKENAVEHGDENTKHVVERLPSIRAGLRCAKPKCTALKECADSFGNA